MPSRVIAFLLIAVLLWSGLGTIEPAHALAPTSTEQRHALVDVADSVAAQEGTVQHHHLDDLPSQAHGDATSETTALLPAPLTAGALSLVMSRPRTIASAEAGPPFLAGPLRPPCSDDSAG